MNITSSSSVQTQAIGAHLARILHPGDVILLHGDLGAGKTTLTQGIAEGLGIVGPVQSPTFTLVAEHDGHLNDGTPIRLYHLDLYRLGGEADLEDIGFEDLLGPADGVSVLEWPERAGAWLPDRYVLVRIETMPDSGRLLTISAMPTTGELAARIESLVLLSEH